MTLQTLFVLLAGALLGPVAGAASQLLYLCLGSTMESVGPPHRELPRFLGPLDVDRLFHHPELGERVQRIDPGSRISVPVARTANCACEVGGHSQKNAPGTRTMPFAATRLAVSPLRVTLQRRVPRRRASEARVTETGRLRFSPWWNWPAGRRQRSAKS
ncbi:MAG: biotin transporter BioY [Gemmatimonadetes bacterium]|nr:biotin transporter BioY [Candidatus Palauibacter rhopaloidicola]